MICVHSFALSLSFEVWATWYLWRSNLILVSAFGSTGFILIPYLFNLYSASTIKGKGGVVAKNKAAQIWFTSHSAVFTGIVMLSGSTYTALMLVSSNVFGLNMLHCGLTKYELKKLFHLKLQNNVFMENVPQLFFLTLYTMTIGEMTESAWFSLVGSLISVLGTTLTFFIERDGGNNILPIEYYVAMECNRDTIIPPTSESLEVEGNELTRNEELSILKHSGRTLSLSRGIAKIWRTQSKSIEVGSTLVTKHGAVTHIVHYLDRAQFEQFVLDQGDHESDVTPYFFVRRVYHSLNQQITALFLRHFHLEDCFSVHFIDPIERNRTTVNGSWREEAEGKKGTVFDEEDHMIMERQISNYFQFGNGEMSVKKERIMGLIQNAERRVTQKMSADVDVVAIAGDAAAGLVTSEEIELTATQQRTSLDAQEVHEMMDLLDALAETAKN